MKSLIYLFIIAICIGAYFMYISPKIEEINNLRIKLTEYKDTLNQSKELKITLDKMLLSYNDISQDDKLKLDKIIPEKFNGPLFVADINGIAFKNAIIVKNVIINETKMGENDRDAGQSGENPYITISASFTLEGQYEQFIKMLKDMESSLQLLDIKSVSIKEQKKTTGTSPFEYLLEIDTYYLK